MLGVSPACRRPGFVVKDLLRRFMSHKILNGLVLKHSPLREADEILTLWSWEEGKIRILARGVRKSGSRLKAVLAPVSWLCLQVIPSERLAVVVDARVRKSYPAVLKNLSHLAIVFNVFEVLMRATPDGEPNQPVSSLLREGLEHMDSTEGAGIDFLNSFRLRFLSAIGYGLAGPECRHCGQDLREEEPARWSSIFLGLICEACGHYDNSARPVEPEVKKYLCGREAELAGFGFAASADLKFKIENLLSETMHGVIERRINSQAFLASNLQS